MADYNWDKNGLNTFKTRILCVRVQEQKNLREEEQSDEGWFALPMEDDPEVNWMDFAVDICGPEHYLTNPKGEDQQRSSPYAEGMFKLQITLENSYPQVPPKIKFITKCWHPNINFEDGKVCADFLTENWKSTMGLRDVLVSVRNLLAQPNGSDNINQEAARELTQDPDAFDKHAKQETEKHAAV
eukprot:gb/GECG01013950.1/.p1 GENE.gb/GECG01013950.1/~~gb/GECG01013950.1/.p1  ORF type:complete len:185 (+),score=27.46 gb/GECG01013950.1/:1-555(+)